MTAEQTARELAEKRFWAKVKSNPNNGCIEWHGARRNYGYGCFMYMGKPVGAHRISFMWANNLVLTPKQFVCHKCDNPPCVNPEHLFLGSQSENMLDMFRKSRDSLPRGEKHNKAKLTDIKVLQIKNHLKDGMIPTEIAKLFGVGKEAIYRIKHRKRWIHIKEPVE